ncbi:MAG: hypothetical protein WC819_03640 [Parcubacteria group bacterium]
MSSYSEGQTHQLMEKLEAEGWTSSEVTKFGQYRNHAGFRGVLNGTHKIVPVDNVAEVVKPSSSPKVYLRDLYQDEIIELGPDDGTKMLSNAKDTFKAGIDRDFVNWGLSKKCSRKNKITVRVREMIEDGTFGQLFGFLFGASPDEFQSFGEFVEKYREDLRKLCVGQGHVEEFAVKYRDKLKRDGYGTFFLLENEDTGEFFVAYVDFNSDDLLRAYVRRLEHSNVWYAEFRLRLVAPHLA